MDTPKLSGRRIRALLGLTRALTAAGLYPSVQSLARQPLSKRRAIKPAPWMSYPIPETVRVEVASVPGRHGKLPVKHFIPAQQRSDRPCILFLHGGGWIAGGYDSLDYLCSNVCAQVQTRVMAVEYRLAPEHPFPAALHDCDDALRYLAEHAAGFGGCAGQVAVMGDSAGGNLSAALCLLVRDEGGPAISQQILIYPALDATLQSPSVSFTGAGLSREALRATLEVYLAGADARDPRVSPLLAADLAGLPPALIITADCDSLRDDGPRYAARLRQAGVGARCVNYLGMPHGFLSLAKLCSGAPKALQEVVANLAGGEAQGDVEVGAE